MCPSRTPLVLETVGGPSRSGIALVDATITPSVVEAATLLKGGVQLMAGTRLLKLFHLRLFWPD